MAKRKATYLNVSETFKKKGDWHWAQAKTAENGGEDTDDSKHYR